MWQQNKLSDFMVSHTLRLLPGSLLGSSLVSSHSAVLSGEVRRLLSFQMVIITRRQYTSALQKSLRATGTMMMWSFRALSCRISAADWIPHLRPNERPPFSTRASNRPKTTLSLGRKRANCYCKGRSLRLMSLCKYSWMLRRCALNGDYYLFTEPLLDICVTQPETRYSSIGYSSWIQHYQQCQSYFISFGSLDWA